MASDDRKLDFAKEIENIRRLVIEDPEARGLAFFSDEQLNNFLLENIPAALFVINSHSGRIVEVNEAFLTLTGLDRKAILGSRLSQSSVEIIPESYRDNVYSPGEPRRVTIVDKLGASIPAVLYQNRKEAGGITYLISLLLDTTLLRKKEKKYGSSIKSSKSQETSFPESIKKKDDGDDAPEPGSISQAIPADDKPDENGSTNEKSETSYPSDVETEPSEIIPGQQSEDLSDAPTDTKSIETETENQKVNTADKDDKMEPIEESIKESEKGEETAGEEEQTEKPLLKESREPEQSIEPDRSAEKTEKAAVSSVTEAATGIDESVKIEPETIIEEKPMCLIIDDEELSLESASDMLRMIGFDVIEARNGGDGIRLFRKNRKRISFIILDIVMPDMDGIEVMKYLMEADRNAKILISTDYASDKSLQQAIDEGATGVIKKPFGINELALEISKLSS
jgi:PAS domain S-box-containing protein